MKERIISLVCCLVLLTLTALPAKSFSKTESEFPAHIADSETMLNIIYVQVFDSSGQPMPNLWIELMNELYQTLKRIQTDNSGRATFTGLSSGNFKVKVFTTGTNYLSQTQDVTIINFGVGNNASSDSAYVDFYLKLDQQRVNLGLAGVTEAVFVQDVPEEARKSYKKGVELLEKNDEKGWIEIQKAVDIFPNYYDAVNLLGVQYTNKKMFEKAVPYLVKAIEVNPRSFSGFYSLGYVSFHLNHRKEALEAFRAATILSPKSINANLWYGTVLRLEGQLKEAEKFLLQAKSLSKKMPLEEVHWQLALLYNRMNRNEEAADELENYLKVAKSADTKKIKELIAQLRSKPTQK